MLLIPNRLSLRLIAPRVRRRGLSHTGTSRASAGALRLDGALILLILLILLLLLLLWWLLLLVLVLGVLRHRLGHHVGTASIRGLVHLLALGRGGRRRHGRVLGVCVLRLRDRRVRLGGLWLLGGDGPAHRDGRRVRVVALGPGAAVQAGGAVPVHHDGVVGQGDDEEDAGEGERERMSAIWFPTLVSEVEERRGRGCYGGPLAYASTPPRPAAAHRHDTTVKSVPVRAYVSHV